MKKFVKEKVWFIILIIVVIIALIIILTNANILKKLRGNILESNDVKVKEKESVCDLENIGDSYIKITGWIDQDYGEDGVATITFTDGNKSFTKELEVKTNSKTKLDFTLSKGEYNLTVSKEGYNIYESKINTSQELNITLHNKSVGDVIASKQIGDNVYYNYYSNGLLQLKGTGDIWSSYGYPDASIFARFLLNDVVLRYLINGNTGIDENNLIKYFNNNNVGMILGNDLDHLREGMILAKEGLENGTCPDRNNSNCDVATSFLTYFNEQETNKMFEKILEIPLNSSIVMEEGIKTLNNNCLNYIKVNNLKIPDSIQLYEPNSFLGSSIVTLILSKNVIKIPDYFLGTSSATSTSRNINIENIIIPYGVKEIGIAALNKINLENIEIPNSVTKIGSQAFYQNNLTSVKLPNSITQIGPSAFFENQITDINIPDKLTIISSSVFCGNKLTKITIPNSVEEIGVNAFRSNELTEAIIPNGVKIIRNSAFENNALINIEIPKSVEKIYYYAFKDNPIELIKYDATNATLYTYGVSNYGLDLFGNTGDGTKVIIGKNVKTIPDKLFSMSQKGSKVKEVYIYNGVTKIGSSSFYNNQIETVRLPNTLTSIGASAFRKNKLTRIVIPEKIASIGNYAFSDNDLTSVTILGNKTRFNSTWTNKGFPEELKPVN